MLRAAGSPPLADSRGPRDVEWVVDQAPYSLDEAHGMRKTGVAIERRLLLPRRMNVEELRIASRPKRLDAQAARLLARRPDDVTQRGRQVGFVPRARVKSRKDEESGMVRISRRVKSS
jgi:hypothetical protein